MNVFLDISNIIIFDVRLEDVDTKKGYKLLQIIAVKN